MPEYLSPGVYVEEIDAGPKPIEGVSTSTAGAVGVTAFGPTSGKPVLVTSFSEYVRVFGGFLPEPDAAIQSQWLLDPAAGGAWWRFPLSVKGFFDNGGQRLYVKRVVSSQATASAASLGAGLVAQVTADAAAQATVVRVSHVIGVSEGDTVRIFRGDTGAEVGGGFTVQAYDTAGSRLALVEPLPEPLVERRGDLVQTHAPTAAPIQAADTTLRFAARSLGGWGDALRVRVRPMVGAAFNLLQDPTIANNGPFATTVAGSANNASITRVQFADVTGFADTNQVEIDGDTYTLSNLAGDVFEITPGLQPGEEFAAGTVITLLPAGNPPTATTVAATTIVPASTTVQMADASGLADGDHVQILGVEYELANFDGTDTFEIVPGLTGAQPPFAAGTQVRRLRQAYAPPGTAVNVWGAAGLYPGAIVELDNGEEKETSTVASVNGDTVTLDDPLTVRFFEGDKLRVIEAEVTVLYEPVGGTAVEEIFPRLRLVDDGSLNFLVNHLQARSALVSVTAGAALASSRDLSRFPVAPSGLWQALSGGDDQLGALSPDDFVGVDGGSGNRTGIQALEDIDEISICLAPGIWASIVHSALIQHCELLKDRFAVLDPPDDLDIQGIRDFREPLDTKYAALYYPWIEVRDPSLRRNVDVGPSGHIAGIYARVDVERGVHKAPANEVIRGITRISDDVTHREQGLLNPRGINALRFFPGRGNRVWGARTLSSDASWKYVNVRRLFLFVEESIDEGTQFVVFEPNSDPTWARVRQTITNFLLTVWRSGALEGTKPDQAFFVKCDRTTMSQDDIDNGRLICVIGIAPVKPAEFVIFRIQQKTLESGSAT
jgi:phage tail sheath protein FI